MHIYYDQIGFCAGFVAEISIEIMRGGPSCCCGKGRHHLKKLFFFGENPKGGWGVLQNPKFLVTEKHSEVFGFFCQKGEWSHPIQKGFIRKNEIFGHILPKSGDFVRKKLRIVRNFWSKRGGPSSRIQNFP